MRLRMLNETVMGRLMPWYQRFLLTLRKQITRDEIGNKDTRDKVAHGN